MADERWHVLDQMPFADGILELVAYRRQGTLWIGVSRQGGSLMSAIGPRSGSVENQLASTAIIDQAWAVGFGAIAPGIVRAEIRNDRDEVFPAKVLALPEELDPEYRAVWGMGERCQERCEIIAYDERGLAYDQADPRVTGSPPTEHERLEAMREHADRSMRYYATAYLRESEESRRIIDVGMSGVADFLALMEGAALDDRSMLARREKIINRYKEEARNHPWEPGVCSFCGARPVVAWFQGPTFQTAVGASAEVRAGEAWLACSTCLQLVEVGGRDELARRGAMRMGREDPSTIGIARELQERRFWALRSAAER